MHELDVTELDRCHAACRYTTLGWSVIPLHNATVNGCSCGDSKCRRVGKHPRIKAWQEHASNDPAQIDKWWREWPDANIGVVTGSMSGLVVIDGDAKDGIGSIDDLAGRIGVRSETVAQRTGSGGVQVFFRHPGSPVANSAGKLAPGVDVRGDKGYVLVPPSRNGSGLYEWGRDPFEHQIANLPEGVASTLNEVAPRMPPDSRQAAKSITQGTRNDTLMRAAGKLRREGFEEHDILADLMVINERDCDPPLDREEVECIAASVGRYPASHGSRCTRP